jgi:hypothetical protein
LLIAQKFMEASGETLTATEKLDLFNNSLLDSAATAKGKARDGILDYIATFNTIPDSKMTEIKTAINEGDLKKATWLLAAASASRTVALIADADVTQATSDLDAAAAARTVAFYGALMPGVKALGVSAPARVVPKGAGATGGIVTRPTNALIGEAGPEMVIPLSSMPGASQLPSGIGGASINLTVHAGLGTDGNAVGQQIVNMLKQYQRTNGPFDFTSR